LKSRISHCLAANNTIIVEVLLSLYILFAHHVAVPAETTHTYSSFVNFATAVAHRGLVGCLTAPEAAGVAGK